MQTAGHQIIIGIISGSIVFLMLTAFIFLFLLLHQRKHNAHIREKTDMRQIFEENLMQTQVEVQEQTRKNLAVDLHDNIGQILSLTNVTLASINLEHQVRAKEKIDDAQQLISKSIQELRRLSRVLQGEQLLRQGLMSAITEDLRWLEGKGYYTITFQQDLSGNTLDNEEVNLFIYRIFQETLNNIVKHSGADAIDVSIGYDGSDLVMEIADNGRGFVSTDLPGKGLGLLNMKKRIELLHGKMEIHSGEQKGSLLKFTLPYNNNC
jgi:signal transduction histidine kinase